VTPRERIQAALSRQPVDRPPIAFWRHVPELDHDPRRLAEAMLTFHQRWNLDLIKVMSSGVYCVEDWGCQVAWTGAPNGAKQCTVHAVRALEDWARITPLDPGAGALGRELEAVRTIASRRHDDAPVLMTLFSPFTVARKLAGERLAGDMGQAPARVRSALEAITVTLVRYARTAFEAGADGLFVATQSATPEVLGEDEYAEWELPYLREVLDGVRHLSGFTLLHLHGRDPYLHLVTDLSVHAINWHDRRTKPTLGQARERFSAALVGGLDEWRTLREGPPATIAGEVRDAIGQTGGVGLIVAPGCVLPLDVPDAHLAAAVAAARLPARRP
jgi:uroporphyrinogen decarboxylase